MQHYSTFNVAPVQIQHEAAIIQDCRPQLSTQDSIFIVHLYSFDFMLYSINSYSIALYQASFNSRIV